MIQRIQTVYFLLAAIATGLLLWCPPILLSQKADGSTAYVLTALGLRGVSGEMQNMPWGLLVLTAVGGILPLVALAGYKNRKRQIKLANCGIGVLILICVTLVTYGYSYACGLDTQMAVGAGILCPVAACVFLWLARRGVKKDEELIRSTERFRL